MKTKEFPVPVKVAAYIRVSTEEQAIHGLSIGAQREALDAWAAENHAKIADYYVDAGISARKPATKRPELQRLLNDVRSGQISLIVFTKLDRWFRNIAEYYKVQEVLEAHNVNWKTIHEDYDTSTASGRLKINIMLSVAQDEADRTSERIKAVFDAKRERKEPCTGRLPTGYKIEGKAMVKDPEMEGPVSCFFETFLTTRSTQKARMAVQERYGVLFTYYHARIMLDKDAYYGRFGGVDDMCPAYITKEQYNEIQSNRRRTERKVASDRVYLFTGLIYCPLCGRRFGAHTTPNASKTGVTVAYNCRGRYNNGDCSNGVNVREVVIEDYLLNNIDAELERYVCELEQIGSSSQPTKNFQAERAKLKKKFSRLKDLYVDDIIDLELYRKDYETLTSQMNALDIEEHNALPSVPCADRLLSVFTNGWQDMYSRLTRPEQQAFWRTVIDKLYIHPTRQISVSFRP